MSKKLPPVGAELVRAWTGASVHVFLLKDGYDDEGKLCCAIVCKDTDGRFSASKFLHSHLELEELLEVVDDPGRTGL